jgi:hypothetical protein
MYRNNRSSKTVVWSPKKNPIFKGKVPLRAKKLVDLTKFLGTKWLLQFSKTIPPCIWSCADIIY